ncbi:MAG: TPM domain-containing protein [Candidatus Marinimicrobia bacterium]|nr:TPM domain-containing protein [Candidatus Neomarinimicrobiota bacterium]
MNRFNISWKPSRINFYLFLLLSVLIPFSLYSQVKLPNPTGFINDFANVLSPTVKNAMENLSRELKQKTGAEVVVVTVKSLNGMDYTDYSIRLFEKWGIGGKGKDNGILIFNAVDARKIRIEVGYGLEGILPDGLAGEIRDKYLIPALKQNDFDSGLSLGLAAVASIIAADAKVKLTGNYSALTQNRNQRGRKRGGGLSIFKIMMLFFVISSLLGRGRGRGRRGRRGGGGLLGGLLLMSMLGGGHRGYNSGGFGGGFGGGGFGGFGGGMGGGGGAGGSY